MNCSARLLAVIALSCPFAGCNLGEGEADEYQAGPVTTVEGAQASATGDASTSDATADDSAGDQPEADQIPVDPQQLATAPTSDPADETNATVTDDTQSAAGDQAQIESTAETNSDATSDADGRYTYSDDHDPNGIGKFYMGREIAQVMGHQGIAWLERPEREEEEGLTMLIECLDIEPGSTVADIGAGSGVLTVRFCDAVGDEGTVVAVDIQQEMLDALQLKCHELGYRNVELVLGTVESPQLPEESVDLVVMVDVYHEFDHPYEMLLNISQSVRPGGRVVFVEYRKEDPAVQIKLVHKMTEAQVRLEAEQPEFHLEYVETIHDLPVQHVIVFRKLDPDADVEQPDDADEAAAPQ